jgi:integrase
VKGNLTRRGQHSWRLKFDAGRDPATGRRLIKYVTLKGTKAEAQRQAATVLAGAVTGEFVDVSRETVAQFVERWLRDWCASNISAKTLERYRELLRVHLIGRVGSVPIQKLRAADLQRVYAAMAEAALADRTRLHLHRVAHRMLKHAVQWGVIARNPAALVDAPSVRSTEVDILTPQHLKTVLETLRGRSLYPIASLALASGMRRGELLALRWQDVDLDGGTLRVERSLEQTKAGLVFKAPKTGHGRRTITLPPSPPWPRSKRTGWPRWSAGWPLDSASSLTMPWCSRRGMGRPARRTR